MTLPPVYLSLSPHRPPRPYPMTTKEYLEQVTIGKLSELSGRILLKEYNPAWATRYEEERRKISQALGQDGVAIEHVGSTSVPGLCAKPILDILLLHECHQALKKLSLCFPDAPVRFALFMNIFFAKILSHKILSPCLFFHQF